jgi:hypothetical protein
MMGEDFDWLLGLENDLAMGNNRDLMKLIRVVVVVAGLLFANGVVAANSSAITPTFCQAGLGILRSDTYAARSSFTDPADFYVNFERVKQVWPRITGAQAPPETLGFLYDFQGALNGLAAAAPPKIDPAVAQRLVAGAQDVIDCIIANNP